MKYVFSENGKSKGIVSISPNSGRVVRFAAKELAAYLRKITGADFRIQESNGKDDDAIRLETRNTNHDDDAFDIRVAPDGIDIVGSNERSALFGVYDLLEQLGCAFVEPGVERVPNEPNLSIHCFEKSQVAAFPVRNIFRIQKINTGKNGNYNGFDERHLKQIDWMAKRKLNLYQFYVDYNRYDFWERYKHLILDALLDRGFTLELTQHSIGYFFPCEPAEDYNDFGPETYQTTHPEWYAGPRKARIDLPEVRAIIFDRFMEFVRRNPELDVIAFWPTDSEMGPPSDDSLVIADEYLIFWNQLAKRLASEFPRKKLSCLAYFELLDPPRKTRGESNLHLWYCPVFAHAMYPMTDQRNRHYLDSVKGWVDMMPTRSVHVFGYYGWYPLFTPLTRKMTIDLQAYRDLGVAGVYGWSGFTYNLMGTEFRWARELNALAELLWDSECDVEKITRRWAEGVFGPAAGDVDDFYQTIQAYYDREAPKGLGGGREQQTWISLPTVRECLGILDKARRKVVDPSIHERLDLLEEVVAHAAAAKTPRVDPRDDLESVYPY